MITQDFLMEFEMALLKSYNRATNSKIDVPKNEVANFVGQTKKKEHFVHEFMSSFKQHEAALGKEIQRGGHQDYGKILSKISQEVESKVRMTYYGKEELSRTTFQATVKNLKVSIRDVFYDKYLSNS